MTSVTLREIGSGRADTVEAARAVARPVPARRVGDGGVDRRRHVVRRPVGGRAGPGDPARASRASIASSAPSASIRVMSATKVAPVPAKYKRMYNQTAADLGAYEPAIAAMPSYSTKPANSRTGFVELLDANGNREAALLKPATMTGVNKSLDAFKRLGVGGVVIGVKLPLLLPQYTPQAAQYTQFFAKAAAAARARGFVVDVELGPLFCGTQYATCSYQYPTTPAGWAQLTAQQARTVIDSVRPDYLDLISEPSTEAILTGIKSLQTPDGFRTFVSDTVTAIGSHGTTKLLAGAASWFPAKFDQSIVGSGIDGLVTHVYPANAGTAANLVATSRVAHDAGLPLIADEVWLYKGTSTCPVPSKPRTNKAPSTASRSGSRSTFGSFARRSSGQPRREVR